MTWWNALLAIVPLACLAVFIAGLNESLNRFEKEWYGRKEYDSWGK